MTVESTATKARYAGNGTAREFPTGFAFAENTHVRAVLRRFGPDGYEDAPLALGADYTLSGAGTGEQGTLTYPVAGSALAAGETLTIYQDVPMTQQKSWSDLGVIDTAEIEKADDKLTRICLQLSEGLERCVKMPVAAEDAPADPETLLAAEKSALAARDEARTAREDARTAQTDAAMARTAAEHARDAAQQATTDTESVAADALLDLAAAGSTQAGRVASEGDAQVQRVEQAGDLTNVARTNLNNVFSESQYVGNDKKVGCLEPGGAPGTYLTHWTTGGGALAFNGMGHVYCGGKLALRANNENGLVELFGGNVVRANTDSAGLQLTQAHDRLDMKAGKISFQRNFGLLNADASGICDWHPVYAQPAGFARCMLMWDGYGSQINATSGNACTCLFIHPGPIGTGEYTWLLREGYVRNDWWRDNDGWQRNDTIYMGANGFPTNVKPAASGQYVQILGMAVEPNILEFSPAKTLIRLK